MRVSCIRVFFSWKEKKTPRLSLWGWSADGHPYLECWLGRAHERGKRQGRLKITLGWPINHVSHRGQLWLRGPYGPSMEMPHLQRRSRFSVLVSVSDTLFQWSLLFFFYLTSAFHLSVRPAQRRCKSWKGSEFEHPFLIQDAWLCSEHSDSLRTFSSKYS